MKTPEQIKQEAEAAFERGKNYHEKKEYDLAIKEYSEAIRLDPDFVLAYDERSSAYFKQKEDELYLKDFHKVIELDPYFYRRQYDIPGECSFCGLPAALTHNLIEGNDKRICCKCINNIEIMERIKRDNETLYHKIGSETLRLISEENFFSNDKIYTYNGFWDECLSFSTKWHTDLSIDELRINAKEYVKPRPPEPIIINNIPIHKNQSVDLLEGEIFKKHPKKDIEVSNLGRVKQGNCILEQYDPKNDGYLFVNIKSTSEPFFEKVYRLVAETWLERPNVNEIQRVQKNEYYNTVHHISNNGYDNRIENLMWVTEWQHAMIHPWMDINNFNFEELSDLFYSYAYINIKSDDYQRIINIAKRMQQLENAESKFPGKYDYWYENIIEAMEDLIKKNDMNKELNKHS
jgi:hypothetical protein